MADQLLKFDINMLWELLLVGGATRAGIFTELEKGPVSEEKLAGLTQSDSRSLWTVVEALVEKGYLVRKDNLIDLTARARNVLYNTDSDEYTGFSFMHGYDLCSSWLTLPEVMRTGKPPARKRSGGRLKGFISAMARNSRGIAPKIAAECLEGVGSSPEVIDIGGGPLTYARQFVALGAKVTVFDLPEVVDMMGPTLAEGSGIEMIPGDMLVALPQGPYDLAYLGNVCHIFGEAENKQLFRRVNKVLKPGGRVVVQDLIRGVNPRAAIFAVNMLVNTPDGGTWSLEQYSEWMTEAGFDNIKMINYGERQLLIANK
ncbi:MAG: methyltransferase [Desulfocucumaceae bacterium]